MNNIDQIIEAVQLGDAVLIDVRSHGEHLEAAARGARHLDVVDIQRGVEPDVEKHTPIYLYCRTGIRANTACLILRSKGYENVYNLGGLTHWIDAGGSLR